MNNKLLVEKAEKISVKENWGETYIQKMNMLSIYQISAVTRLLFFCDLDLSITSCSS